MDLLIKIFSIIVSWLLIGLPINNCFKLTTFSIALVFIIYGKFCHIKPLTIFILSALLIIKLVIPQIKILETNNVFLLDENNAANVHFYQSNLPPTVFNYFKQVFNDNYLKNADCSSSQKNCWRNYLPKTEPFNAFSAEQFWQDQKNPSYSRIIHDIDISNRINAKIGTFNDIKYNFFDPPTNNIYRQNMPFFIVYQIPKELLGMQLYWHGEVLWPSKNDYRVINHEQLFYKTITTLDLNKKIYIPGISNHNNIKLFLNKTFFYKCCDFLNNIITIIGLYLLLSMFQFANKLKISWVFAGMLWQLLNIHFFAAQLLQGSPILEGGGDGLVFYGYSRIMLQQLIAGNYLEVLRGAEDTFYFMPGLRYLRLIELIIFGDSAYGYLLFLLFIPVIMFNFLRSLFSLKTTIVLISLFFIPWLKYFGFANDLYIKFTLTGYSEAYAYGFFLLASTIILNSYTSFFANLLLAIAVFLRPNLAIISGIIIIWGLWKKRTTNPNIFTIKQILINLLGFSPVLFMLWHNVYFAGEWSLFTGKTSFNINLMTPPSTYIQAVLEVLNGNFTNSLPKIYEQLHLWNRGVYFFRWPAILSAIYCLYSKTINDPKIKLISLLGLVMQSQFLFFNAKLRYAALAWNFCFLAMVYYFIKLYKHKGEQYILARAE